MPKYRVDIWLDGGNLDSDLLETVEVEAANEDEAIEEAGKQCPFSFGFSVVEDEAEEEEDA